MNTIDTVIAAAENDDEVTRTYSVTVTVEVTFDVEATDEWDAEQVAFDEWSQHIEDGDATNAEVNEDRTAQAIAEERIDAVAALRRQLRDHAERIAASIAAIDQRAARALAIINGEEPETAE